MSNFPSIRRSHSKCFYKMLLMFLVPSRLSHLHKNPTFICCLSHHIFNVFTGEGQLMQQQIKQPAASCDTHLLDSTAVFWVILNNFFNSYHQSQTWLTQVSFTASSNISPSLLLHALPSTQNQFPVFLKTLLPFSSLDTLYDYDLNFQDKVK